MAAIHNIQVGTVKEFTVLVTPETTIAHLPEHACFDISLPRILSTPALIKFMEMTAGMLILPHLPKGWICVGTKINVSHLAPALEGARIKICATVTDTIKERVTFFIEAFDKVELIGSGTHTQALVELSRFMKRVNKKSP